MGGCGAGVATRFGPPVRPSHLRIRGEYPRLSSTGFRPTLGHHSRRIRRPKVGWGLICCIGPRLEVASAGLRGVYGVMGPRLAVECDCSLHSV